VPVAERVANETGCMKCTEQDFEASREADLSNPCPVETFAPPTITVLFKIRICILLHVRLHVRKICSAVPVTATVITVSEDSEVQEGSDHQLPLTLSRPSPPLFRHLSYTLE
jgi:hypothetical protein